MIQILKDLNAKDKEHFNKVIHDLFIRGQQLNRSYVRYSFQELEQIASFLSNHQYDVKIPQEQIDSLMSKFNSSETEIYQTIAKRSKPMRESLPDTVRKENQRTRQYVQSLLSGKETAPPKKKDGLKALNKLKASLS